MSTYSPETPVKAPSPTYQYMREIEEQAILIRKRAGLGLLEPFNPRILADKGHLVIHYPKDVPGLSSADVERLSNLDAREWSGMGHRLPDGRLLVVLNPGMTIERESVTILEEVAHDHYGHRPSILRLHPMRFEVRKYAHAEEQQAKWTAAAALVPALAVARAARHGQSAEDLAITYVASVELTNMRIGTLLLRSHFRSDESLLEELA